MFKRKLLVSLLLIGIIVNTLGLISVSAKFKDVPTPRHHWAYESIVWITDKELMQGYLDNTFKPDNLITEAEFLTVLLRTFPNSGSDKVIGQVNHWADGYYLIAHQYGLPVYDQEYRNIPITRGQVAQLISAALGKDYNVNKSIEYMYELGLSSGRTGKKTIADFYPNDYLTRAETVQFIRNLYQKYNGNPKLMGVEPIEGTYATLLRWLKLFAYEKGYNFAVSGSHSGNILNNENPSQTIITFSPTTSEDDFHRLFINQLDDDKVLQLSKEIMHRLGVPVTDQFIADLLYAGYNGETLYNKFFGDYRVEYQGDNTKSRVTVRFKLEPKQTGFEKIK